jgi:hypothetical protein
MTKELIERYLQFAIGYWYDKFKAPYNSMIDMINFDLKWNHCFPNIIETITSWPFIEAIFRGWYDKYDFDKWIRNKFDTYWWSDIDKITFAQAIAIRDNKLDEFIQDLLPKN